MDWRAARLVGLGTVFAAAISACAASGEQAAEDTCGAWRYQSTIGANIAAVSLPADLYHRIIRPGDAVTRDYRRERINFYLDEDGRIARVECG